MQSLGIYFENLYVRPTPWVGLLETYAALETPLWLDLKLIHTHLVRLLGNSHPAPGLWKSDFGWNIPGNLSSDLTLGT